jgi:hypothetical protein
MKGKHIHIDLSQYDIQQILKAQIENNIGLVARETAKYRFWVSIELIKKTGAIRRED